MSTIKFFSKDCDTSEIQLVGKFQLPVQDDYSLDDFQQIRFQLEALIDLLAPSDPYYETRHVGDGFEMYLPDVHSASYVQHRVSEWLEINWGHKS